VETASRPGNYEEQARTYDLTRGASPTVVRAMARHLGPADGRRLLDIGGGTGTYAQVLQARGFDPVVVDAQLEMVARSVPKLGSGHQVVGDATALPFGDATFDRATIVIALHLMRPPQQALAEARRVLREGPLVVVGVTAEQVENLFVREYFRDADRLVPAENPPGETMERLGREAGFSGVEAEPYVYLDSADGSLPALHTDPLKLAGPAYLRNTSFFQRLPDEVRTAGLAKLAEDLRSGALERRVKAAFESAIRTGHGTVFVFRP
jgi:ubiquinone/menaquinone biosynthesis C-methylase UbiE